MLTIQILNLAGTETERADYSYVARVNGREIARGFVQQHRRADGWRKLVERIALQPEGSATGRPPSGGAVDPSVQNSEGKP